MNAEENNKMKTAEEWFKTISSKRRQRLALKAYKSASLADPDRQFSCLSDALFEGFHWYSSKSCKVSEEKSDEYWRNYYKSLLEKGLALLFCLICLTGQAQTLTLEIKQTVSPEVQQVRQTYRVPRGQTLHYRPEGIRTPFFELNPNNGDFSCPMYQCDISGPSMLLEAYDRETDCVYSKFEYGSCDGGPEYTIHCLYRRGEYYVRVVQCGIVLVSTGNVFLIYVFPKGLWDTNQQRPIMASQ